MIRRGGKLDMAVGVLTVPLYSEDRTDRGCQRAFAAGYNVVVDVLTCESGDSARGALLQKTVDRVPRG